MIPLDLAEIDTAVPCRTRAGWKLHWRLEAEHAETICGRTVEASLGDGVAFTRRWQRHVDRLRPCARCARVLAMVGRRRRAA